MQQEITRILNLVLAVLLIAAVWALATMRASEPSNASRIPIPHSKSEENSHA
ncbi:MAG: hypothetical protein ACK4OJ_08015 [Brevundimonas sp.]